MVNRHPNRIYRAANDSAEGEDNAEKRRPFAVVALMRQCIKVRSHSYTDADRNQGVDGHPRQRLLVHEEIDRSDRGREEHAADLVEWNRGIGEGEVLQNHVQTHRRRQGEHFEKFAPLGLEESEWRSREKVEEQGGHEEVVGCETELGVFEKGGREEGFVGEDLG